MSTMKSNFWIVVDLISWAMANTKIDLHAHYLPPIYRKSLHDHGYDHPDGMPAPPDWNVSAHLAFMQTNNISKSILSISAPGIELSGDPKANSQLASACNDYGASLKQQYPEQLGYFAVLPLSDAEASIAEIHRLDSAVAKPDGYGLHTNSKGIYLGDPIIRPILAELDKRRALVFLHPNTPCNYLTHQQDIEPYEKRYNESQPLATFYPSPLYEFFFDSARSIIDYILVGNTIRYPSIRWIISHSGGVLPSLIDRVAFFCRIKSTLRGLSARDPLPVNESDVYAAFREHFWYDLAGLAVPNLMEAMLKFTGKERFVYGSDTPWTPWQGAAEITRQIERDIGVVVGEANVEVVLSGTAKGLIAGVKA